MVKIIPTRCGCCGVVCVAVYISAHDQKLFESNYFCPKTQQTIRSLETFGLTKSNYECIYTIEINLFTQFIYAEWIVMQLN